MGYSSVKETIRKSGSFLEQTLAEINQYLQVNKFVIIVEGDSDVKLYSKMYNKNNVVLRSVEGKENIYIVLKKIKSIYLIAIRDADFRRVLYKKQINRLFLTDHHDLEMQILSVIEIIDAIKSEYSITLNLQCLFKKLHMVTLLRVYQDVTEERIELDKIHIHQLNTSNDFTLEQVILDLKNKNCIDNDIDPHILFYSANVIQGNDYTQITNGHDLIKLIISEIKLHANKQISSDTLESTIRIAYHNGLFSLTNLAVDIDTYCKKNNIPI